MDTKPGTLSPALAARRPLTGAAGAIALILGSWAFVAFALEHLVHVIAGSTASSWVAVPGTLVGFEVSVGLTILTVVLLRLRREVAAKGAHQGPPPAISVLVAAYEEVDAIGTTLAALVAQKGVQFEVLVGDDGSNDGTHEAVIRQFGCTPNGVDSWSAEARRDDGTTVSIRLFRLPHAGKGATLNALSTRARFPILVTLDADTTPSDGALVAMARAFLDPEVVSAAGVVSIRNGTASLLNRYQSVEYQRITWVRAAWSSLGALEQVPGAFTGVRAPQFAAVGGFPTDSLTEDYELTYRLVDHGVKTGRVPVVAMVLDAQVWTEGPTTVSGFVRQRTRWFAGFLTTLARFRHLIFESRAAAFGLVRFPMKVLDAVMPVVAFASLAVLVVSETVALRGPAHLVLTLFAARWGWDAVFYSTVLAANALTGRQGSTEFEPSPLSNWLCVMTDSLGYGWLRYATTLRAYTWALRNIQTWEPSREPGTSVPAAAPAPASIDVSA